jgi:2-keto-4-pentenoate hydratase/2-oxohepta-3-ene-1,7-dioic acid hydratase in catechol pathway
MKYLVGRVNEGSSVYAIFGDKAVNLTALKPEIGSDLSALIREPTLIDSLRSTLATIEGQDISQITPVLPIAHPGTVICMGLNYTDHIKEGGYDIPDYPALFMRGKNSLIAAGEPMVRPSCSEKLDYEAELMLIIGKRGRHITPDQALEYVFGYTTFNDGSVRDYQRKTHQWTPGKNFDGTGAIGPFVVTSDDLPKGASGLKIESRVGSEILQSSNTANMIWGAAELISAISEYTTLEPGDFIAMGTPPGVGHAKKPNPRWLKPGDVIEVEIEGIGVCSNPVVDEGSQLAWKESK